MCDWQQLRIGEHITFLSGFPFASEHFAPDEGVPLVRIRDLATSSIETRYRGPYDPKWLVKRGDILIGMDGDFSIVRWRNDEALLNQRIVRADAKHTGAIDKDFFFHWCGPELRRIHGRTAATTVKHLSVRELGRATAQVPTRLEEQRRIAEILSTVDEAIEQTEALIAKTQQIKAGLMHDLFTRGVTPDGQLRPLRGEAPLLYKESPLGWVPRAWEVRRLRDFATIVRGASPRPKGDPRFYGGSIPRLMVEDVTRDGKWVTPRIDSLTEEGASLSRPMPERTLTIVCSGTVGVPSFLAVPACIHDGFIGFARIADECDPDFLFYLFSHWRSRFESGATHGGIFTNLTTEIVRRFEIAIPPRDEQQRICVKAGAVDCSLLDELANHSKLRDIRKGLMYDLFRGRVSVEVKPPQNAQEVLPNV